MLTKIIAIYIVYNPRETFMHGANLPPSEHGHIEKNIIKITYDYVQGTSQVEQLWLYTKWLYKNPQNTEHSYLLHETLFF